MTDNRIKHHSVTCIIIAASMAAMLACSRTQLVQDTIVDLPPEQITLAPTGGSSQFVMTFNDAWSISVSHPSWIICDTPVGSSSSKEGTFVITVSADVNRTEASRSGYVTFSSKDGSVRTIPVVQPNPYLKVSILDANNQSVESDKAVQYLWNQSEQAGAPSYSIRIDSNVDWKIVRSSGYGADNFYISDYEGFGSKTVAILPKKNNLDKMLYVSAISIDAYMTGDFDKKIGDGVDSYTYQLSQRNLRFLINNQCEDVDIVIDELNNPVSNCQLAIDSELSWSVAGGTDWVQLSSVESSAGVSALNVIADGVNPTLSERRKDIILKSSGGAERILHIKQTPYIFNVDKNNISFGNNDLSYKSLHLETTGPWAIANVPSWLKVSPLEGEGYATITISCVDQNLNLSDNVYALRIDSKLNNLSKTADVKQAKFLFDITPDDVLGRIPTLSTLQYNAIVVSSGDWSISADQGWIDLSTSSGTGNGTVKVGAASNNPDINFDRASVVTLVSETHKAKGIELTRQFNVVQRKFVFAITPGQQTVPAFTNSKLRLNIVCSGNWELIDYPSWLVPDILSGEFDANLNFSVATYTNKNSSREGRIKVRSVYNDVTLETAIITQEKFVFEIDKTSFSDIPPASAPSQSININCTEEAGWTIKASDSWAVPQVTSGKGSTSLIINPLANPKRSERAMTLSINNSVSNETITINLTQNGYVFYVVGSYFDFSEIDASVKTIEVNSSSDWAIDTKEASWINVSPSSGTGNSQVRISVDKNTSLSPRQGTIQIYSNLQHNTADELSSSVLIHQDEYKFNSNGMREHCAAILTTPEEITVPIVCSGKWSVSIPSGETDWVNASPMSGDGDGKVTLSVSSNTTLSERTATVTITSQDNLNLRKVVTIEQDPFVFKVTPTSSTSGLNASGATFNCRVECTADWEIASHESWIKVDKERGTGDDEVKVTIEKNSTKQERSGILTFKSQYNHTNTVRISQNK